MIEILCILIVATFMFVLSWRNKPKEESKKSNIFISLFASVVGALLGLLIGVVICSFCGIVKTEFTSREELYASNKIIALADNSNVSAQFFLGCGSVGQDEYYVYYTETLRGYKQEKVRADSVYVKYLSDNETPHIEHFSKVNQEILTKKPNTPWLSFTFYLEYKNTDIGEAVSEGTPKHSHTIIYIPEGSIQENYTIDSE